MLSEDFLKQLKTFTLEDGLHLSDPEILDMGTSLISLMETIYKPLKREWTNGLSEEDREKIKLQ